MDVKIGRQQTGSYIGVCDLFLEHVANEVRGDTGLEVV